MRKLLVVLAAITVGLGLVSITGAPASAQTEGGGFCDVFGALLGEDGQAQCEDAGGDQVPLGDVTTPTCEAVDMILTEVEGAGGGAVADPLRQIFTDTGACVFAQEETTTTAAPTTAASPPTTDAGRTLAATGGPLALTGLAGLGLGALALGLRRLRGGS